MSHPKILHLLGMGTHASNRITLRLKEDIAFEGSLSYIARALCLKQNKYLPTSVP